MPGHPDPRMNLGLTLERAGSTDLAIESYRAALEARPGHVPSTQALARLLVRSAREDEKLSDYLDKIALEGETSEWREWAKRQRLGG